MTSFVECNAFTKPMPSNDFIDKYHLKNKAKSSIKSQNIVSSLSLNDVRIFPKDGPFNPDKRIVNSHPSKGTHWVTYKNQNDFDSYGCSAPQSLSKNFKKRNGLCL